MGRAPVAVSLFDDAAAATLAAAGGAASPDAAAALVDSLRAAALSRVLTTGAPRCLRPNTACIALMPRSATGEVPTLACLADVADCAPASAAAARALQAHGASVATTAVVSERNSVEGAFHAALPE